MSENAKNMEEEFSLKCPSCENGSIKILSTIYEVLDGEKLLLLNFECNKCNFHKSDVIPVETRMEPGTMILRVTNEHDLKSKIYRSPTGRLEIPELELIVEPVQRADFYFTNVEGILLRFENAVSIYKNNLSEHDSQKEEIDGILKDLNDALNGRFPFTLKMTDLQGGSYIIPQDKSKFTFKTIENHEKDLK